MITYEMISRELVMLAIVAALGAWPASLLGNRFDLGSRIGLAPVLGICAGTCIATTLLWFAPASDTFWLFPVLGAASLAAGVEHLSRNRSERGAAGVGDTEKAAGNRGRNLRRFTSALQLLAVILVVAAPITYAFIARNSVGPVGYRVGDAQGYVASIDAAQRESLQTTIGLNGSESSRANLEQRYASSYAAGFQELDATPLIANVDELLGLWGTDSQGPFLIALLAAGALGLYGATRYLLRRPSWAAAFGGALFGGAFFLQLFFDGSEGALLGLSVLAPLAVVGAEAIRVRQGRQLALASLTLAGLSALYPLFLPAVGTGSALVCAPLIARRLRAHSFERHRIKQALVRILGVLALAVLMNVVDAVRTARYLRAALGPDLGGTHLPHYPFLGVGNVTPWLTQARQFYDLSQPTTTWVARVALTIVIPLLALLLAASGLRHSLTAWIGLGVLAASGGLGAYERIAANCSYCEDRSLLPIAPVLALLVAIGLGTWTASRRRAIRLSAVACAAALGATLGTSAYHSIDRYRNGAYFLDTSVRTVLAHVPKDGDIDLEGFDENADSIVEQGLVYMLVEEHAWGRVSLPADKNESSSLEYLSFNPRPLSGPQFNPRYRYVLTRMPGVQTERMVMARSGGVGLERRIRPLDVVADYGLLVPPMKVDAGGYAYVDPYVNEPMQFVVSGAGSAYVKTTFKFPSSTAALTAGRLAMPTSRRQLRGRLLTLCTPVPNLHCDPRTVQLTFALSSDVQLTALEAVTSCR